MDIVIKTDGKIIMAFTDPVDGDENPYKFFTDNFTGEGPHTYYIFNTVEEFITKWEEIHNKPNGMWYWVLDNGELVCSGACDPSDIEIFKEHWKIDIRYTVILYYLNNGELPYVINNIEANDKDEAISKAKDFVANNGFFGNMYKKDIIEKLIVSKITMEVVNNDRYKK